MSYKRVLDSIENLLDSRLESIEGILNTRRQYPSDLSDEELAHMRGFRSGLESGTIKEKYTLEALKSLLNELDRAQNYKEIAERHGFNIWSSNGNAGFPGNNPSARIESIYVGYLNMDDILASSEDEAVKVAYDFIMSELIKNDFICNYQQDKNYAQKLFLKYMEGRSK